MASTKAGSSSRALSLALEREKSRWKPCCKRSSSRDEKSSSFPEKRTCDHCSIRTETIPRRRAVMGVDVSPGPRRVLASPCQHLAVSHLAPRRWSELPSLTSLDRKSVV